MSLEEACSSLLPVIVPDFGAIGRITEEWDLGLAYEHGSDGALVDALKRFARDGVQYLGTASRNTTADTDSNTPKWRLRVRRRRHRSLSRGGGRSRGRRSDGGSGRHRHGGARQPRDRPAG